MKTKIIFLAIIVISILLTTFGIPIVLLILGHSDIAQAVFLSVSIFHLMFSIPFGLVMLGHSDIGEG